MRSIFVLLILVMIGLNGKGQSVTALPDSVLSQCCLEVTLLNGNVTTVDWVFIQYITRDGTGTKLFVEYAPNFGGIQWETQIRIQDNFDDVLERSKFIVIPFTVGSTDYGINRNWIANIEENITTGGTWIYGRFGTPTKRKFSAVEDYETMKNLLLACRPRAIVVAENGLYTEGDTVRMGGFLIENTSITTEGYNWQMKDTLSSVEFGLDYNTPETLDTTVYWARRHGSLRQMVQLGRRYYYNSIRDTTGGLYSDFTHSWNSGDPFLQYQTFNPSAPTTGTAWFKIQKDNSFLNLSNDSTNPFYSLGWAVTNSTATLGASESGSGDPGNGVIMGAYGFGTTEYLFMKTKAVDAGTATSGQYLQLIDNSSGEVDFATIDLSAYLPISDTAAMLDPYIQGAGTINNLAKFTAGRVVGNAAITENGSRVVMGLPTQLKSYAVVGLPTGSDGDIVDVSNYKWPARYNSTAGAWVYPLQSSLTGGLGTATRLLFNDANGRATDDGDLFWNSSSNYLSILRASPAFNLDVNGTARVGNLSLLSSGNPGITGQGIVTEAARINFISQGGTSAANTYAFSFAPYGGTYSLSQNAGNRTMALVDLNATIANSNYSGITFGMLRVRPTYNFVTLSAGIPTAEANGILYDPTLTSMYVTAHNAFRATSGNIIFATSGSGALGMGTLTPNGSSVVDFNSTAKGSLLTRMNTTQRNAIVRSVLSATVTNAGSGYTTPPTMTITGGGGTGAIAFANISAGGITSIAILNQGENYSSTPTLTITGGGGTGGTGTLTLSPIPESLLFYNTDSIGFEYRDNASNFLQLATKSYARSLVSGLPTTNIYTANGTSAGDRTYNGGGFDLNFTALDTLNKYYQRKREYINGNKVVEVRGTTIRDYDIFGALNVQNRGDSACLIRMVRYAGIQSDWTLRNDGTQFVLSANGGLDDYFRFYDDGDFRFTDYVNALTGVFDVITTVKLSAYGTPATTAAALSKTLTNYGVGFATDGTVTSREIKRDTTIYVVDADYDFSAALTTAQVAARHNRVIFLMTTTAAAGSDSELTLHTPDINLMQCEYLVRSTDEAGGFDNRIIFGTNNAVDSTNGLVTNYYPSAGSGVGIRAGLRSGVYKYFYY